MFYVVGELEPYCSKYMIILSVWVDRTMGINSIPIPWYGKKYSERGMVPRNDFYLVN